MAAKCQPSTDIYTMLINVYGKVSLNSCAGFPFGATEIFSLMQYMGCYPDRASYNIMVDAYGRAGLHEGRFSHQRFKDVPENADNHGRSVIFRLVI
ncbi:hypothetical protein Csa_007366 [Cucumis sativus]|nr:hypothetical protein Csa_007366 [Cucumis sativus]